MKRFILLMLMVVNIFISYGQTNGIEIITFGETNGIKVLDIPINSSPSVFVSELKTKGWNDAALPLRNALFESFSSAMNNKDLSIIQINCLLGQFIGKSAIMATFSHKNEIAYIAIQLYDKFTEDDFDTICILYISKYGKNFETFDNDETKMYQWIMGDEFVELTYNKNEDYANVLIGYGDVMTRAELFLFNISEGNSDYLRDI